MAARSYNKTNGIIYFDDTLRAASRIAELTSEEAQQVFSDLITSFAISNESRMSKDLYALLLICELMPV